MELFQLRYFVAAARMLHFRKAAESLHSAQPSLSAAVRRLEIELGAELFHRTGRRVALTDAGAALLPIAERMLEHESEARRAVQQVLGLERGRLTLCALPALDQHLLPPWLARFRKEHPGVDLRVRELRPADAVAAAVVNGTADLGFVHLPCEAPGLSMRPLLNDPLLLVVPAGHRFADCSAVDLAMAADEEFVWVHDAQEPDHPLYGACLAAGFAPRIVCESGSAQGVLALVAAGLGCALLPRLAIEPRAGLSAVPLADPAPYRTLAVVWDPDRLSCAAERFLHGILPPEPAPKAGQSISAAPSPSAG